MTMAMFRVGSTWKHRNTGELVKIREAYDDGRFRLVLAGKESVALNRFILTNLYWTAAELIREFELMDPNQKGAPALFRVLHNDSEFGEE